MSRTVHHVRNQYRLSTLEEDARPPSHWMWITQPMAYHRLWTAFRYSAAIEAAAEQSGHRPRPALVARRLWATHYPRTYGCGASIKYRANRQERSLRAADRVAANRTRHLLRGAEDAVDAAWDAEFRDPRHRHFAVWDSW